MKRADYNEFLYIRSAARRYRKEGRKPIMWHIRVSYSAELKQKINDLNVFPIPDGDTGDNMLLTIVGGAQAAGEGSGKMPLL